MLLAIDTSAGTSVAVVDRERGVLSERSSADTRGHAEIIGTFVAECVAESGVPIAALSGIVAGMGPGPFTGLRVGIAAAQAFALGADAPLVRVVSHDAIAFAHYSAGATGPLLVVTDARRREVYWSAYRGVDDAGIPERAEPAGLARPDDLVAAVAGYDSYERLDAAEVSAAALGLLAEAMFAARRSFAGAAPLYLRAPDAVASTGPKRVS